MEVKVEYEMNLAEMRNVEYPYFGDGAQKGTFDTDIVLRFC